MMYANNMVLLEESKEAVNDNVERDTWKLKDLELVGVDQKK